ncbi:hypothetical protein C8R47DRAFT_1225905 [Mycena vitilis]|nr:hypothetical protein C8R47DRAFT_1225905 [Mycena vitilis]
MASGWISESDIPQIWKDKLQPAVIRLLRGEPLPEVYTVLYTTNPRYTTSAQRARELIVALLTSMTFVDGKVSPLVDLYTEVAAFFATYTAQIPAPDDDAEIPYYYDTQWGVFSRGIVIVDPLFAYLNRDYVQRETNTGVKTIRNASLITLEQWKMNVFETLAPRLERALGADSTHIAVIRAKYASEHAAAEDFKAMRFHGVSAGDT